VLSFRAAVSAGALVLAAGALPAVADTGAHTGAGTAAAAPATEAVPSPTVTGPVETTATSHPFLSAPGLAERGYVEREYFLEGTARCTTGTSGAYRTRLVVRQPAQPTDASGAVVLEWNNVTGGYDQEYEWFTSHDSFMRAGVTWAGLSNQFAGVTDLKRVDPDRYGSLHFPGDLCSEDVFSQAAQALRAPAGVDPLAGQPLRHLIAGGHSQSGTKLTGYYHDFQPRHRLVDGFMIRGNHDEIRTDEVRVPVIRVQSETTLTDGADPADLDGPFYRRWDVAGTSHVDKQQVTYKDPLVERDRGAGTPLQCVKEPFSRVPFTYALSAAYSHMVRWLDTGVRPPVAPRFAVDALGGIARDGRGNALGGIRLPEHEVPTATSNGDNSGVGFCILYGSHEPFDAVTLRALYPTRDAYVQAFDEAAQRAVRDGFVLPYDGAAARRQARRVDLGLG
jgi:hypothetical protein